MPQNDEPPTLRPWERPCAKRALADPKALDRMMSLLDVQAHETAVDLGPGSGNTALALARRAKRVIALDNDETSAVRLRQVVAQDQLTPNVEVIHHDFSCRLPFDDGGVDVVTCRAALHHFSNPERVFSEAARILVPGGRLDIMDGYFSERSRDIWNDLARVREPDLAGYRTLHEVIDLVRGPGLEVALIIPFKIERDLHEWLLDAREEDRSRLAEAVFDLPDFVRAELMLERRSRSSSAEGGALGAGWFFYYNAFEMVAVKRQT